MSYEKWEEAPVIDSNPDDVLHITVCRLATAVVVAATGEIDLTTVEQLATAVREGFESRRAVVVVDLTGVRFMGSVGLGVLAEATHIAGSGGQALRVVVRERHAVFRTLAISGMADHLSLFHRLDDAIAAP